MGWVKIPSVMNDLFKVMIYSLWAAVFQIFQLIHFILQTPFWWRVSEKKCNSKINPTYISLSSWNPIAEIQMKIFSTNWRLEKAEFSTLWRFSPEPAVYQHHQCRGYSLARFHLNWEGKFRETHCCNATIRPDTLIVYLLFKYLWNTCYKVEM